MKCKTSCSIDDLKKLEVVNLCDGCILGHVCDVEMDLCSGSIVALLVPRRLDIFEIFRKDCRKNYRIPWCQIERIGNDTILVRYNEN